MVIKDNENLRHLLEERAEQSITPEEVEDVLLDPKAIIESARASHNRYIGQTTAGRYLAVITLGVTEIRPETAWQITGQRFRRAHEQ
jgi:hypothetical protein